MSDLHKSILCCLAGIVAALVFCVVLSRKADEAARRLSNLDVRLFVLEANERARQPVYTFGELPNSIHRWRENEGGVYWLTVEVGLLTNGGQLVWRNHTN